MESDGNQAVKQRGLRVIRAVVTKKSSLIGMAVRNVDFRKKFKAAIIAIQKNGRNMPVSSVVFGSGDIIVLQADDDSPLLKTPPKDFYKRIADAHKEIGPGSRSSSVASFVNMVTKTLSQASIDKLHKSSDRLHRQESGDVEAQGLDNNTGSGDNESQDGMFFIGDDSMDDENVSIDKSSVLITDMVRMPKRRIL